jgi:hypothetical protein
VSEVASAQLAYVDNQSNHAIIKVDNTSMVDWNYLVRIASADLFPGPVSSASGKHAFPFDKLLDTLFTFVTYVHFSTLSCLLLKYQKGCKRNEKTKGM